MNEEIEYYINGFLFQTFRFRSKRELDAWMEGAWNVMYSFSFYKNGVLHIGSSNKTLTNSWDFLNSQYKEQIGVDFKRL